MNLLQMRLQLAVLDILALPGMANEEVLAAVRDTISSSGASESLQQKLMEVLREAAES